jgi:hypothetical protein
MFGEDLVDVLSRRQMPRAGLQHGAQQLILVGPIPESQTVPQVVQHGGQ